MGQRLTPNDVLAGAEKLPAFPKVLQHLIAALDDEGSSLNSLVALLQRDPVLSGKVLARANQLLRADRRQELHSISAAVAFIGWQKLREIVLTASLADFAQRSHAAAHFWEHSLAVAIAAQELSLQVGLNPDYAFIAGLLHDLGQLWLAYHHPHQFETARALVARDGVPTCEAEQQLFGMDHGEIGGLVADYWELPAEISLAIGQHHRVDGPWDSGLLAVIHVAEGLCNGLDLPPRPANQVVHLSFAAATLIGLDWGAVPLDLFGRIEARFAFAQTALN